VNLRRAVQPPKGQSGGQIVCEPPDELPDPFDPLDPSDPSRPDFPDEPEPAPDPLLGAWVVTGGV
jgi:hypothetical protein